MVKELDQCKLSQMKKIFEVQGQWEKIHYVVPVNYITFGQ